MTGDTVDTTYRGYPIRVRPDKITVQGPNRQNADFTTMAAARKFIRDLIALEMTGTTNGAEPAAEFTPTPQAPVISSANGALTEQEAVGGEATDDATSGGIAGRIPAESFLSADASPCSVSATTAEPCVNKDVEPAGANGTSQSGSSNVAALNYLRGME